ncbi:MAG: ribonuclease R [Rikenellaceae bacterium]|nr:ribonuclease R [Rikenellaceae bacterium]
MGKKRNKERGAILSAETRRELVLGHMRHDPLRRHTIRELTLLWGDGCSANKALTAELMKELVEEGVVSPASRGRFMINIDSLPSWQGIARLQTTGNLYVTVEGFDEDIMVNADDSAHALDGDVVRVSIVRTRRSSGRVMGVVTEIVERVPHRYVGTVEYHHSYAFIKADSRRMPHDIFVKITPDTPKVEDCQKVLVEVDDWDVNSRNPIGHIVEVLGYAGDNETEMHAILAEFGLPYRFDEEVEEDARAISGKITAADYAARRDFRGVTTFTIDPDDAKDFDDALSIRHTDEGLWEVGVHIADVTHYVRPGSVVESEALERATSVYLVDRTIPMLPERLSNELCSLRPGEEKLCFSAVFTMNDQADILDSWFGRTVILSDRRFTYAEAQQIIETVHGDYATEVLKLNELAQILRKDRFAKGAIGFEREEVRFELDEKGKPLGVKFKIAKESNQLIEEFMLLANRSVAEFVGKRGRKASGRTFVYRIHDKPDSEKLARFSDFVLKFGHYIKTDRPSAVAKEMNRLMKKVKGSVEENVISILAVRAMAKAVYSTDNIGHYGLAFPYYTHFTSPIRRYPDMMVHRLLADYLAGEPSADKATYEKLCEHSSEMEIKAAEAERASIKYKMVEFMEDKIGMEFDGHISGISDWGIFVELDDTHIEGMVSMRDMTDDFYNFDEANYAAVGKRTGRRFMLGDGVRICVKQADLRRRQLDFEMVGSIDFATGRVHKIE